MTKSSPTISALISRIERAPNCSLLIDAYDAALGGSDVSLHRYRGQWQVWHGERSGYCGAFSEVRAHLTADAEESLDRGTAAQVASEPTMVAQQAQQQQACAAAPAHPTGIPTDRWLDEEVHAYVARVLEDLLPDESVLPRQYFTDLQLANYAALAATKEWVALFEQDRDDPLGVPYGLIFDARQRMQDAHAKVDALTTAVA